MNDGNAKQQIVEKIKSSSNILVTVSNNPSVDELSAALGLTLMLNKMQKHTTAVFSGSIPPAITFLDPEKTFESTVDSLRDFIIALDKEKADHLRYKVDGDVVKIFITPYRTTISSQDLDFSQGDYNVELVLALGVKQRDNLDGALTAHGRILHDATVATMSAGEKSDLGSIDWHESSASSLSEMLVTLSDALKGDKPLLDEQIATAFLTGVVAATDRFSNNRTSSKVMTMAAQLMAAGANQQLIAAKLEDSNEISPKTQKTETAPESVQPGHPDGTTDLSEGESQKLDRTNANNQQKEAEAAKRADGALTISHEEPSPEPAPESTQQNNQTQPVAEPEAQPAVVAEPEKDMIDTVAAETAARQQEEAARVAEQNLAEQLPTVVTTPAPLSSLQDALQFEATPPAMPSTNAPVNTNSWQNASGTPSMGGTLNATAEQAADDQRKAEEQDRNRTILSHNNGQYIKESAPSFQSPLNAAALPVIEPPTVDSFGEPSRATETGKAPDVTPLPTDSLPPLPPAVTLADLDKQNRQAPHEEARAAVDAAFGAIPFTPSNNPQEGVGAQLLGEVPHVDSGTQGPSLPPLPDFSTLPPLPPMQNMSPPESTPLPPENLEQMLGSAPSVPTPPKSNDPGQFKIPGQ